MIWELLNPIGQIGAGVLALFTMLAIATVIVRQRAYQVPVPLLLYGILAHWVLDAAHKGWWAYYRLSPSQNAWMFDHWVGQVIPWFIVPVAAMHLWIVFKR